MHEPRKFPSQAGPSPAPFLAAVLVWTTVASVSWAQTGTITGKVTDEKGGGVGRASVVVVGAQVGTMTSPQGDFVVTKVPVGKYRVRVRMTGFATEERDVSVAPNGVTFVEFQLVDFTLAEKPASPGRFHGVRPAHVAALGDPDVQQLERDARRFAVDLYGALAPTHGNLFFSPWSIRTVLGMVYAGASGRTQQQMTAALRDSLGPSRIHFATSRLDSLLRGTGSGASPADLELRIAQGAWVAHSLHLESGFADTLRLRYAAPPNQIDFARGDEARAVINTWVEGQTRARIRDLIPPGALTSMTRLAVCDAIYFRGAWQDSFPARETANAPFHLTSHEAVPVPFMRSTHIRRYMANADLQMLEISYRGGDLKMLVIVPTAVDGLAAIEGKLDPDSLAGWIALMENTVVRVALPKSRMRSGFQLKHLLSIMGMPEAFDERADFSSIARERPLFISDVYHKAFVAVDEHGTEASAASAVVHTKGAIAAPPRTVNFTADHPFLFLICHRPSGTILFMGRVADPR